MERGKGGMGQKTDQGGEFVKVRKGAVLAATIFLMDHWHRSEQTHQRSERQAKKTKTPLIWRRLQNFSLSRMHCSLVAMLHQLGGQDQPAGLYRRCLISPLFKSLCCFYFYLRAQFLSLILYNLGIDIAEVLRWIICNVLGGRQCLCVKKSC